MDRITFNYCLKVWMETLANLESFVRSAETGGFSAAARRLSLTPAAVSRNVAMLERNLGIRLFRASPRKPPATGAGQPLPPPAPQNPGGLAGAGIGGEPAGVLK